MSHLRTFSWIHQVWWKFLSPADGDEMRPRASSPSLPDRTHLWPCRPAYGWQLNKLFEWKTDVFDAWRDACNTQPQLAQRPDVIRCHIHPKQEMILVDLGGKKTPPICNMGAIRQHHHHRRLTVSGLQKILLLIAPSVACNILLCHISMSSILPSSNELFIHPSIFCAPPLHTYI